MIAAFGTGGTRGKRKWQDRQFLENHAVLRVGGLRGSEVVVTLNGQSQVVQLEQEWTFGRRQRLRPWFRCPDCNRRCRILHEKDGVFLCRICCRPEYDYLSRHRNRSCPSLNRVRRVAGLPLRALARERIIAQVEIARSLRAMVQDLQRRARRGKR